VLRCREEEGRLTLKIGEELVDDNAAREEEIFRGEEGEGEEIFRGEQAGFRGDEGEEDGERVRKRYACQRTITTAIPSNTVVSEPPRCVVNQK